MEQETLLHPEWKQALREIMERDPKPGDVISREWLEKMFGLSVPKTFAEFKAWQLKWMRQFDRLRDELLTTHQLWIRAAGGGNYEIVHPSKQTDLAYSDYSRQAFLKLKRMVRVAQNVRLSELTDGERKANTDSLAKMSMLVGMVGTAMIEDKRGSEADKDD